MSNESFRQHNDSVGGIGIGKLITTEKHRDAIHIAVAPIEAAEQLNPGQHVGIENNMATAMAFPVGIVDPFLEKPVLIGEKFWLFLEPGSITSLRHMWTHPGFDAEKPESETKEAELWLRLFAAKWEIDFDYMIEQVKMAEGLTAHNTDIHSWGETGCEEEFWEKVQIYTGETYSRDHRESVYFSCSC